MLLIDEENFRQRALHCCLALEMGAAPRLGPALGTGAGHRRHRLAAGAARAPKTIRHLSSLHGPGWWGVDDARHSVL